MDFCKQDCIRVGCVPPACCPYLPACIALGGCLVPGECLVPGGAWSRGWVSGGSGPGWVPSPKGGGGVVSQQAMGQTSPVNRILDTRL